MCVRTCSRKMFKLSMNERLLRGYPETALIYKDSDIKYVFVQLLKKMCCFPEICLKLY